MAHKFLFPTLGGALLVGVVSAFAAGFTLPGPEKVAVLYFAD